MTLEHKTSLKSLGYICNNSQKYTVWVKIIDFSFMPKLIRTLSKYHVMLMTGFVVHGHICATSLCACDYDNEI